MRFPRWVSRSRRDAELEEEIRSHLAMDTAVRIERGESPESARLSARREFGNVALVRTVTRETWGGAWLEHIVRDWRQAWRTLGRSPVFTGVVVLILSLGIGINGAVVSIIDTAFFRRLPVPNAERIVEIRTGNTSVPLRRDRGSMSSFPDAHDLATNLASVGEFGAYAMDDLKLGGELAGTVAWGALVTGNYFHLLGVPPQRGRMLDRADEETASARPVAVISDRLWRTAFGADESVLGRQITIGSTHFDIVGVMPPRFTGTHPEGRTELWIPYTAQATATANAPAFDNRGERAARIIGRLAPGVTLPELQGRLDALDKEFATRFEADRQVRFIALHHDRFVTTDQALNAIPVFLLVWVMVGLLHLVACSNVAGLLLARASARRREIGVRLCLGASRGHVLRLVLSEPLALAVIGSAGGILVARWLTTALCSMRFLSALDAGLDARLLAIILGLTTATMLFVGLMPARESSRTDPAALLRGGGHAIAGGSRRMSTTLIGGQVAVSLVLLAAAAAMLRGFQQQANAETGYDTRRVVVASMELRLPPRAHADPVAPGSDVAMASVALRDLALSRVSALPGVERVATSHGVPMYHGWFDDVKVAGYEYGTEESSKMSMQTAGPGYFATIGAAIVRGREFTSDERGDPLRPRGTFDAVIVNEAMTRRYWPGADPIGQRVSFRSNGSATVVGVVRDMRDASTLRPIPRAYFPALERFAPRFEIVVRTNDPELLVPRVRAALSGLPSAEPPVVQTLADIRGNATMVSRVAGITLTVCASVALLLTAVGLYGLVSMWADERRREIGIRMALGATTASVHRLVLRGAGRPVVAGAIIGTIGAALALRVEQTWIGPVMPLEPVPLLGAILALGIVAGVAAIIPSYRATRVSAAEVMRDA